MKKGALIVFEGLDGCGKSTQLKRAAAAMRERGYDIIETREPTDGSFGRKIRAMAQSDERVPPETELEWFFEDRREHMQAVVRPGIENGKIVFSDRSYFSTVAYQGARGLDANEILRASEAEFVRPDLVLLFEIDPAIGLARVAARGGVSEPAFENQAFLEKVAAIFGSLELESISRIDADRSEDEIAKDVAARIEVFLAGLNS